MVWFLSLLLHCIADEFRWPFVFQTILIGSSRWMRKSPKVRPMYLVTKSNCDSIIFISRTVEFNLVGFLSSKPQFDAKPSWWAVQGAWGIAPEWDQGSHQVQPPSWTRCEQAPLLTLAPFCQTWRLDEVLGSRTLTQDLFGCPFPCRVSRKCHIEGSGASCTLQPHLYWHCVHKYLC